MKYQFREQVSMRGCFCEIDGEVIFTPLGGSKLVIKYEADSKQWEDACVTGIKIFFDYFARVNPGILEIYITNINWLPVDTNNLIVLFANVKALCSHFDFSIEGLSFDKDSETFLFPEPRKKEKPKQHLKHE